MVSELACNLATDPICGASFDEEKAAASIDLHGSTYYFCSSACRDIFAEATLAGISS